MCEVKVSQSCLTLCDRMDCRVHGILQVRILEWVSCSLLQGILQTQGLNPGLPHCRQILYHLSHQGSPRILDWVVYPFSSRSSQPRYWTVVSCIAGWCFTNWARLAVSFCPLPCSVHLLDCRLVHQFPPMISWLFRYEKCSLSKSPLPSLKWFY